MVPSQRLSRKSGSSDLLEYMARNPVDRSPKNDEVARIVSLQQGTRMLIEVESLNVSDRSCVAGNLCIVDGPNRQSFPEILLHIHTARYIAFAQEQPASDNLIFIKGQTAYVLDELGRAHECTVDGYHGEEIFVSKEGKPYGWFSDDTLFHSTAAAYASVS